MAEKFEPKDPDTNIFEKCRDYFERQKQKLFSKLENPDFDPSERMDIEDTIVKNMTEMQYLEFIQSRALSQGKSLSEAAEDAFNEAQQRFKGTPREKSDTRTSIIHSVKGLVSEMEKSSE